jgi:hypothetical protein
MKPTYPTPASAHETYPTLASARETYLPSPRPCRPTYPTLVGRYGAYEHRPTYPTLVHVDRPTLHLRAHRRPTYPTLVPVDRPTLHLSADMAPMSTDRPNPPLVPVDRPTLYWCPTGSLPCSALPESAALPPQARPTYPIPPPSQASRATAAKSDRPTLHRPPRTHRNVSHSVILCTHPRRAVKLEKSRRRRAYPQQIVTTRLLYCLQDPFAQLSRLQRI